MYNPYNEIYTVLQNNDYLRFINSLSSESFQNRFMKISYKVRKFESQRIDI